MKIDHLYRNSQTRHTRSICIDPGVACTATATLVHSAYDFDNINLSTPRGPRAHIDRHYRNEQSQLKVDAGIPAVEAGLVPLKLVEVKYNDQSEQDQVMEDVSGQLGNDQSGQDDEPGNLTQAMDKAAEEYKSSVMAHIVSEGKASSVLRNFYGGTRFKKDTHDYREAIRHDLDKATTAVLNMRKFVPDRQPTKDDFLDILRSVENDVEAAKRFAEELPSAQKYDITPLLDAIQEARDLSGMERDKFFKSKRMVNKARSLYKRGYLNRNQLPDDKREAFLASPLIIGIGDGDFRGWRGQGRGTSKFTMNLIRRVSIDSMTVFCDRSKGQFQHAF